MQELTKEQAERFARRRALHCADALERDFAWLKQLRESRGMTQTDVAARLAITQEAVSKLEKGTNPYLATLRAYIEALGGKLEMTARFGSETVQLNPTRL